MRWRLAPNPRSPPENRRGYWVYLFARLKPGVALEQARAAIDTPYRAIINEVEVPLQEGMSDPMMAQFRARGIRLDPGSRGQSRFATDARVPLTLLLAVTTLVLLIACVNVANLLLARAAARAKELATRLSLGATRGRLIAQLLTESSVLAFDRRDGQSLRRAVDDGPGSRDAPRRSVGAGPAAGHIRAHRHGRVGAWCERGGRAVPLASRRTAGRARGAESPDWTTGRRPRRRRDFASRSRRRRWRCRWCSSFWQVCSRRALPISAASIPD